MIATTMIAFDVVAEITKTTEVIGGGKIGNGW
jgi:hypothetical protein